MSTKFNSTTLYFEDVVLFIPVTYINQGREYIHQQLGRWNGEKKIKGKLSRKIQGGKERYRYIERWVDTCR